MRSLLDLREDGWDKVFNTNVKAVWLLSRAVARRMIEQKSGRIINITHGGRREGRAGYGRLRVQQSGVEDAHPLHGPRMGPIRDQCQCRGPGLDPNRFQQTHLVQPRCAKHVAAMIPKGRLAEPEEIVGSVLFLASDAANFITGHSIYVDGGTLTT